MRSILLKLSVALFSFIVVYTFTWSIVEPIPIFDNKEWLRWYFILVISLIVVGIGQFRKGLMSFLFYRYCKPWFNKKLQLFSSGMSGDSLGQGWKNDLNHSQTMQPIYTDDHLFNKVYEFTDATTFDAIHGINVIAKQEGKVLDYFIKPLDTSEPVIYIQIEIKRKSDSHTELKWVTLVIDKLHQSQTTKYGDKEEIVSIGSKAVYMQWMIFSEDIYAIYKGITRWSADYTFNKINAIKVRGNFQMSRLVIYA